MSLSLSLDMSSIHEDPAESFSSFYSSLPSLSSEWSDQTVTPLEKIQLCKISSNACSSNQPLVVSLSLTINEDFTWKLFVLGQQLEKQMNTLLCDIPYHLDVVSFSNLYSVLDSANICTGNSQSHFVDMANSRKGMFLSASKQPIARLETEPLPTIRTVGCDLLISSTKCCKCMDYESTLRALHSRWVKNKKCSLSEPSKFTNNRYLKTPEKMTKLKVLQEKASLGDKEIKKLWKTIQHSTEQNGVEVDENLHTDLVSIMKNNYSSVETQFPVGTFRHLFWTEQMKCAMVKNARQMRWHPTMIKWCLNLKLLSSAAYHSLRSSGFVKLPSERTLRDYTHFFKSKPGFQVEVEQMLMKEIRVDTMSDYEKFVVLIFDEMKIKESIVYDKHSSNVIGFVELNDVYDQLFQLEHNDGDKSRPIATHILAIMVRGIFSDIKFPFAHFPTKDIAGDHLFSVMWEAIERIERLGLKVVALTADGSSSNRKNFRMHSDSKLCTEPKISMLLMKDLFTSLLMYLT